MWNSTFELRLRIWAKLRATPHDSEKEDKGREQISFAFSYPNLNKKKQIEQD